MDDGDKARSPRWDEHFALGQNAPRRRKGKRDRPPVAVGTSRGRQGAFGGAGGGSVLDGLRGFFSKHGRRGDALTFDDLLSQMLETMQAPSAPAAFAPSVVDVNAALAPYAQEREALAARNMSAQDTLRQLDQTARSQSSAVSNAEAAANADRRSSATASAESQAQRQAALEAETVAALQAQGVDPTSTDVGAQAGALDAADQAMARAVQDRIAEEARQNQIMAADRAAGAETRASQADAQRQRSYDEALFGLGTREADVRAQLEAQNAAALNEAARFNASAQADYQDQLQAFRQMRMAAPLELQSAIEQMGGFSAAGGGGSDPSQLLAPYANSSSRFAQALASVLGTSNDASEAYANLGPAFAAVEEELALNPVSALTTTPHPSDDSKVLARFNPARWLSQTRPGEDEVNRLIRQYFGQSSGGGSQLNQRAIAPLLQMLSLGRPGG